MEFTISFNVLRPEKHISKTMRALGRQNHFVSSFGIASGNTNVLLDVLSLVLNT
jgi:hypothetical protein